MKHKIIILPALLISISLFSQQSLSFDDYFIDRTMRIDYFHSGDSDEESITIDCIYRQPVWAGTLTNLIDPFNNGKYAVKVYDIGSNRLIFSKGYSTIFGEYQTTDPAINGQKRIFHESVLIPYPKYPVRIVFESRDRKNILHPIFITDIDPKSKSIIKENVQSSSTIYKALYNGDPHKKVDIVFIAEGYCKNELEKFKGDVDRFTAALFGIEPYKRHKKKFNIYGVFKPSEESGVDEPTNDIYKNTVINSSFNALGLRRYLLTEDNKSLRKIASCVPYDAIIILVNSTRYGGGGIYNLYAISTAHNKLSENVLLHEFGHSFAGLADEYFSSAVAYNEFYPGGVEPLEPNITAFLNPTHLKWKSLISRNISIPTDWGREIVDSLRKERNSLIEKTSSKIEKIKTENESSLSIKRLEKDYRDKIKLINQKIEKTISTYSDSLEGIVGLFEGAGYSAKGLYRPEINCLMRSNRKKRFCKVCQKAIEQMILYYSR